MTVAELQQRMSEREFWQHWEFTAAKERERKRQQKRAEDAARRSRARRR